MFRASETEPPMNLFDNLSDMMCKRAAKKYDDPKAWQNQFKCGNVIFEAQTIFRPVPRC